jgi:hypothetical protein
MGSATSSSTTEKRITSLQIVIIGVVVVLAFVVSAIGVWWCCRSRRKTRERREGPSSGGGAGYGEMREREREVGSGITTGLGVGLGNSDQRPSSLTRNEVMGVVSGSRQFPSRLQTDQEYYTSAPSLPLPRTLSHTYSDSSLRYLTPSVAGSGSRHSRWTDDSEFDVMAEDGSTITRTLSTFSNSTRRSLATVTESPALNGSATLNENPFDHPAYTYRSAPQQLVRGQTSLSRNGTLSSNPGLGTGTWSSQSQTQSQSQSQLISPITPTSTATGSYLQPPLHINSDLQSDTYSMHSSEADDDGIYGFTATPRPGLRREPTIIRHSDSAAIQGTAKVEKRGRDGVLELPPLYEDATSGWSR